MLSGKNVPLGCSYNVSRLFRYYLCHNDIPLQHSCLDTFAIINLLCELIATKIIVPSLFILWGNNSYLFNQGKETSDPETGRQCPFFEELHAVFTERARNMQRQLLQSESGTSVKGKLKRPNGDQSSGESHDRYGVEVSDDEKPIISKKQKAGDKGQPSQRIAENSRTGSSSVHDLLQEFLVQQQNVDMLWHETMERRAQERLIFEQEWRQSMQKLEQERLMLEQSWIEQEEKRRMREEARAQKRDSLMTTLLNKLLQEDL